MTCKHFFHNTWHIKAIPLRITFIFMVFDFLAIILAWVLSLVIRHLLGGDIPFSAYMSLIPLGFVFLAFFVVMDLYPGLLIPPHKEFKYTCIAISLTFFCFGAAVFMTHSAERYSRGAYIMAWILCLVLVPYARIFVRHIFSRYSWWGYPVLLVGTLTEIKSFLKNGETQSSEGFKPQAVFAVDNKNKEIIPGLKNIESLKEAIEYAHSMPGLITVCTWNYITAEKYRFLHSKLQTVCLRIVALANGSMQDRTWTKIVSAFGSSAIISEYKLLDPTRRLVKRCADIVLLLLGFPVLFFLIPFIALAIKLHGKGPVFFGQKRIGKNGKPFTAWKFRTMVPDADTVFTAMLKQEALREEWEKNQKVTADPRITKVGHVLRKLSLDELPQLYNVLKGEMSLIGPRPIVEEEVTRYGQNFNLYTQVPPGLTGLWQISGRSSLHYSRRVALDVYYIQNWSLWMDFYILLRTPETLLTTRGAV